MYTNARTHVPEIDRRRQCIVVRGRVRACEVVVGTIKPHVPRDSALTIIQKRRSKQIITYRYTSIL